jgi:hypothetical protein
MVSGSGGAIGHLMKKTACMLAACAGMWGGAGLAAAAPQPAEVASCAPDRPCAAPGPADNHRLRLEAEAEIRSMLIDPGSAQFEWPYGLAYGSWRPTIYPHQTGFLACGTVNSKNRYGGYIGAKWFSVILRDDKAVLAHIDQIGGYAQSEHYCPHLGLPEPQPGMLDAAAPSGQAAAPPFSVADEIAKLAALRDKGDLTQREFEMQKAALLRK